MGSGDRSAQGGRWTVATIALAAALMASAYAGLQQDRPPTVAEALKR